jgi:hypothetical protein
MLKTAFILIDEPIRGDRRVLCALEKYENAQLIDLTLDQKQGPRKWLSAFGLILQGFILGVPLYFRLRRMLKAYPSHPFFSGMLGVWKWGLRATANLRLGSAAIVYGNDLYCTVAAVRAAQPGARVIYDSHEIQFHRNRKVGWLRILIEAGLERMVLGRADEMRAVNHAIVRLMVSVYGSLPPATVRYNDFYAHHPVRVPNANAPLAIVYVGKGLRGRRLEVLDKPPHELGIEFHVYPLGSPLPSHLSGTHWRFGPEDYDSHLFHLVQSRRCLMWCCHENTCLSYRYALPNKFFQALAVGVPVIVERGTYLADIVERYELGATFDGNNLDKIIEDAKGALFENWCANIPSFRRMVRDGRITI